MADKYRNNVTEFKKVSIGNEFFCYDTETTGLKANENDIIEFSAVKVMAETNGTFTVLDEMDIFINPGYPLPPVITEITDITDEKLAREGLSRGDAASRIYEFLGENPLLIGYNSVSFDTAFMDSLYRKTLGMPFTYEVQLDVLTMVKEKTPKPHKLIDMAYKFGIAENYAFHASIDDAKATLEVFKRLLPMYDEKEDVPDMTDFRVTNVARWTKSETLDRVYVNNNFHASVYYDVVNKRWEIGDNLPDDIVIKAVLDFKRISSIDEIL